MNEEFGRYWLEVDEDKRGDFADLAEVFEVLEAEFQFRHRVESDAEVWVLLEDWSEDGETLRLSRWAMSPEAWALSCADVEAFEQWLGVAGWQQAQGEQGGVFGE